LINSPTPQKIKQTNIENKTLNQNIDIQLKTNLTNKKIKNELNQNTPIKTSKSKANRVMTQKNTQKN